MFLKLHQGSGEKAAPVLAKALLHNQLHRLLHYQKKITHLSRIQSGSCPTQQTNQTNGLNCVKSTL